MAAEVRLDRMIRGGKEMRPKMNKYRRLLLETQAIKDKYTMGYFRTLKEYIVAVGHKVIRTQEELHKTVMENEEEQADVVQEMIEAGAAEDNEEEEQLHEEQVDRPELVAAGFPNTSFVDPITPSRARPIGVTARVQMRRETEEESMRKKSCVVCQKKFRDGQKRKSAVVKCNSCSELTHLRCAKNAQTPFYCCKCPHPMEQPVDVKVADVFLRSALDDRLLNDADALLRVEDGQLAPRQDPVPLEASVEAEPVPLLTSTQVLGQLRILEDILQPVDELPPLQPAGELPPL